MFFGDDFNFRFIRERMFGRNWMIILRLFQSSFLSFTKTVRADCFLGVRFRVEVTSVFDYDIVFGERERECCKFKSRFRIRVLGKIML